MSWVGIILSVVALVAALFVHPAFLITMSILIVLDIYFEGEHRG